MEGNRLLRVPLSDQLDGLQESLRVVEVTVRQDHRLDLAEVQAHPSSIAFKGVGIGTCIKEHRSFLFSETGVGINQRLASSGLGSYLMSHATLAAAPRSYARQKGGHQTGTPELSRISPCRKSNTPCTSRGDGKNGRNRLHASHSVPPERVRKATGDG